MHIITYFCIGIIFIMAILMIFVQRYIGLLRILNNKYEYIYIDEAGNELTSEQKRQQDKIRKANKINTNT